MRANNHFAVFLNDLIQSEFSLMDTEEMIALRHSGTEMFTGCELSYLG